MSDGVHDHSSDMHAELSQTLCVALGLRFDHRFVPRHENCRHLVRVRERSAQSVDARSHLGEKAVCAVGPVPMRQRAHHEPMLVLHQVEHGEQRAERVRHRQQPKCVSGRRGVDHDSLVHAGVVRKNIGERQQREDLVDAGKGRVDDTVDIRAIEIRAAIDDLGDDVAPLLEKCASELGGGQLSCGEMWPANDRRGIGRNRVASDRCECRRGIGRQQQCFLVAAREQRRDAGGECRFADAAFADHERCAGKFAEQRVERCHPLSLSRATRTGPPLAALPSFSRHARTSRRRIMISLSCRTYSSSSMSPSSS
ncbi:MAG: hypothetical protein M3R30_07550, partial [Candidatus Eremiobacteraeota bacterium]|nr:hypothetical protein [Candidatus Eremiobacteraeota bacterium]